MITREDGSIERFLEKPTWGQVFSDTINTGIFVLEPEIFDYIERRGLGRLLERRVPPPARGRAPAVRCGGRGLLGGRRHARGLRRRPQGHPRRQGPRRDPRLRGAPGRVGGRGRRGPSRAPDIDGPAVVGDNCRIEDGARLAAYSVLGANVRVRGEASLERTVVHDNAYLGEAVRLRGTVVGRSCDLRNGVRTEEGVVLGDECFVGEDALLAGGCEGLPVQDGRGRRDRQQLDRVGVARRAQPVRASGHRRPRERGHHARASRSRWPWRTAAR